MIKAIGSVEDYFENQLEVDIHNGFIDISISGDGTLVRLSPSNIEALQLLLTHALETLRDDNK